MSRKINPNFKWGKILKKFRIEANLNQTQIADAIGYKGGARGDISEIEQGKLPVNEQKVRLWVQKCDKNMFDFYFLATTLDGGSFLVNQIKSSKKSIN